MSEDIVIVGASGAARDILWLLERINERASKWNVRGFIDNQVPVGTLINGVPVLGGDEYLLSMDHRLSVVIGVGNPKIRKRLSEKFVVNKHLNFPSLIDPSAGVTSMATIGRGVVVYGGSMVMADAVLGEFSLVHITSTVGHDTILGKNVSVYPGANVAGNVVLGDCVEIGTGAKVIQGVHVGEESVIGAGAVVICDLPPKCTAVGIPAKPIKFFE